MRNQINGCLLSALLLGSLSGAEAAPNVRLYGTLVTEPCTVVSETIDVDFGTIVDKYLYLNEGHRTPGQRFAIELADCDLSLGNTVKVMFVGKESLALPGLLTVGDQNRGVAIGIETLSAQAVKFNEATDALALSSPNSQLDFKAYVQGEPDAVASQTIVRGAFSETASFRLDYP
ncbi:fimbrial protein [uncultured Cedecea sp.]|uniref:fimbrial protein n=1 Tax=uncultured Cedecea sp. TaxID=988762 RepID=UPI00261D89A7|nr:fimbrial protein [uncultured Cedecea sp.]